MTIRRRAWLEGLAGGLGAAVLGAAPPLPLTPRAFSGAARAEIVAAAANGPVTLLTAALPDGASDLWVRAFAPFLERHLPRRSVRVRSLSNDGPPGLKVLEAVAGAGPDGLVLGHVLTPDLLARARARGATELLDRVRFLGAVTEEPLVLVAPPGTELTALRPGSGAAQSGTLALPPPDSAAGLASAPVERALEMSALHFPSGAAARQAAMAGTVAAALVRLPDAIAAIRDGKLAALGLSTAERCALLPDTPTLAESGIPLRAVARRGFILPRAVEPIEAEPLANALRLVVGDEEFTDQARALGVMPRFLDGTGWAARLRAEPIGGTGILAGETPGLRRP